jgi:hypothetical protein
VAYETRNTKHETRAIIIVAIALSALYRWYALTQTPFANGWDSYFYLIQVKAWIETGRMHSPEASLIYPYFRLFYAFTADYILMYKVGVAVLCGLFTLAVFLWAKQHTTTPHFALLPAAYTAFSPHLTYFAAQYPKNLLGMVLFVGFVTAMHLKPPDSFKLSRGSDGKKQQFLSRFYPIHNITWCLLMLLLNYAGHRLTFGLCLVYGGVYITYILLSKRQHPGTTQRTTHNAQHATRISLITILCIALAYTLPGLLHWSDSERLGSLFPGQLQFAPWSFVRDFGLDRLSYWWIVEIVLALFVTGWVIWKALTPVFKPPVEASSLSLRAETATWAILCLLLLYPMLEWSLTGLSYRLFLVWVLLLPMMAMFSIKHSTFNIQYPTFSIQHSTSNIQHPTSNIQHSTFNIQHSLIIFFLLAGAFSWRTYQPARHDPNYNLYEGITQTVVKKLPVRPELVIAPNALAEYFTFTTGIDAMPWLSEYPLAPDACWRIAGQVRIEELQSYLPDAKLIYRIGPYVLLRETDWQRILQAAQKEGNEDLENAMTRWPNPMKIRPAYLLRRKQ